MGLIKGKGRLPLAVVAAASIAVVGAVVIPRTLGFFDASTTNPGNSIAAGTLAMTNSDSGSHVFTVLSTPNGGFKPGDTECNSVTITNSGTLPAQVELTEANASTTKNGNTGDLKHALQMSINQGGTLDTTTCGVTGGTSVYSGAFDSLSPNPVKLTGNATAGTGTASGDWKATEAHTFVFVITFPGTGTAPALPSAQPTSANVDNAFQGESASADLNWYSTQSTVAVASNS